MSKFKVGDEVIVIESGVYSITDYGSVGIVVGVDPSQAFYDITVEFSKTTGNFEDLQTEWPVDSENLEHLAVYTSPLYQALK